MKDMKLRRGISGPKVFVICRVFHVASRAIAWRLYFAPKAKGEKRELEFTVHDWAVRPRVSADYM